MRIEAERKIGLTDLGSRPSNPSSISMFGTRVSFVVGAGRKGKRKEKR